MQVDLFGLRLYTCPARLFLISFTLRQVAAGTPFSMRRINVALKMTYRERGMAWLWWLWKAYCARRGSQRTARKNKSLIAKAKRKIVLNMDNVTFIDQRRPRYPGRCAPQCGSHRAASLRLWHLGSKSRKPANPPSCSPFSMSTTPRPNVRPVLKQP